MKKNIFLILFITVFAVCFSSCKEKEKEEAVWCTDCTKTDIIGNYRGSGQLKYFYGNENFQITEADSVYLTIAEEGDYKIQVRLGQQELYSKNFSGSYDGGYYFSVVKGNERLSLSIYKNNTIIEIKGVVSKGTPVTETFVFEVIKID